LELAVSPITEIYLDDADAQQPELDARLTELKAGDKVIIQAKAPRGATRFTAGMIIAETPTNIERSAQTPTSTERMSPSASK
jgi:hypothetical protein